jgi:transposase-like protein
MKQKQAERREEWRQRIEEQEESGVSIGAYCKQHGIAEHVFYGWRQRVRSDERVSFALVKAKPSTEEAQPIELMLGTGERLRIPRDEATLAMVLRVLRSPQ